MKAIIPQININDYDYELDKEKIAEFPLEKRDLSKLLYYKNGKISKHIFKDITEFIPKNSLLVVNSTKVIAARILMNKPTGGAAEVLCVEPVEPSNDPQITMASKGSCVWECIIGGRKLHEGILLKPVSGSDLNFQAKILKRDGNSAIVEFTWKPEELTFAHALLAIGKTPLPPYIKREAKDEDLQRYQTVYANHDGSVAAPTAGLHFTPEVMRGLKEKGISLSELILHVGPGTFKPIEDTPENHDMHSEQIFVELNEIEKIYNELNKEYSFITATGTTSLRTLETLYWVGVKIIFNKLDYSPGCLLLNQDEPYIPEYYEANICVKEAFKAIIDFMNSQSITLLSGRTKLFIMPGYSIMTANALITNFHMPKSTLLLLVAAFVGKEKMDEIYDFAINNEFRFFSYGDSSLLIR